MTITTTAEQLLSTAAERGPVAVVGGGWSGIATAWYLRGRGLEVELLESSDGLGGRSASGDLAGREVVFGGKNIGHRYERFREFARCMGDPPFEPFGISSSRIEDGRLRSIDSERRLQSTLDLLRGLPPRDVWRLVTAGVRVRRDPDARYAGTGPFAELAERHGDPTLDRWFGPRACDRLARPMTVRMNGAEPDEVHLGTFGTNIGAVQDTYDQLRTGFGPVFARFAESVPCHFGLSVRGLVVEGGEVVGIHVRHRHAEVEDRGFAGVVLALPAHEAARLVAPHLPAVAEQLRQIRYFPAGVVLAKYRRPVFEAQTRAVLLPPDSPVSNAGAYGVADLDVVRYTVSGRAGRAMLGEHFDPEAILADVERRLAPLLPLSGDDREAWVARQWDAGLCAYSAHHAQRVEDILAGARSLPGLDLTGDWLRGGTIEGCFRAGAQCADTVARNLAVRL